MHAVAFPGDGKVWAQPGGNENIDENERALSVEQSAHFIETSLLVVPVMKGQGADDEIDRAAAKGQLLCPTYGHPKAPVARCLYHAGSGIDAEYCCRRIPLG
jgi:hypothetical protein